MRTRATDICVEQYSRINNCAQVKGAAKIMVTVVATQELEAGDVLRRFKAEVSQDEPHRGNNTNRRTRSTSARCLEIVAVYGIFLTCVSFLFSAMVHVYWCVAIFLRCFVFLYKTR